MIRQDNPTLQLLWDGFLTWLLQPELTGHDQPKITQSLLLKLYTPSVDADTFWGRIATIYSAYLALPQAHQQLRWQLSRLSVSSSYRLPEVNLDPAQIDPHHAIFLDRTNWYRNASEREEEFLTAVTCIGMTQLMYDVLTDQNLNAIGQQQVAIALVFWATLMEATVKQDATHLTRALAHLNAAGVNLN